MSVQPNVAESKREIDNILLVTHSCYPTDNIVITIIKGFETG